MIISMAAQELSWEDILIAYSTLPGYVANRDCTKGTWFVQSLCKVFMEHAHNTNLRDMLDLVALDLKQNFTSETAPNTASITMCATFTKSSTLILDCR